MKRIRKSPHFAKHERKPQGAAFIARTIAIMGSFLWEAIDHPSDETMGTHNCDEIRSMLRLHSPDLRLRFGVGSLELFGSFVRHENRPDSDLDILVTFDRTPGLLRFIELEQHLSDLLGVTVDLVPKDSLKPSIGRRVLREALPI